MDDVLIRLNRMEKMLEEILSGIHSPGKTAITEKWLTEPQVMEILNLTKRGIEKLRAKHIIRTSSATGRNFKYYRADVENYLYDHSVINKRRG